ncbi:MAG: DUF4080 domain-containing protein [Bacillota bacterium]|jgi:hypothetical protein
MLKKKVLLAAVNSQYIHSNPAVFALEKVAQALPFYQIMRGDWSINMPKEQVLREICQKQPQIIGLSVYIWNDDYIKSLASDLRKVLPNCLIVVGGPQAAAAAEDWLSSDLCQVVVRGEGEDTWFNLLKELAADRRYEVGALWADADKFQPAPQVDLADVPLSYSVDDLLELKNKIIYYESSRGCPYGCSFCASGEDEIRFKPLDKVYQELAFLAEHRQGQIKFVDRTFNADPQRAAQLCEFLLGLYRPGLSWHFEISPFLLTEQLLTLWRKAPVGYFQLEMGVQSLNQQVLKAINRHGSWQRARPKIEHILAADNCHLHLDLIAGLPYETFSSFERAFNELHKLYSHHLQLGFLKVLPGSRLAAEASDFDLVYSSKPPYQILSTPTMTAGELFLLQEAADMVDLFYNSGRFRQTLFHAVNEWPSGALDFYIRLAALKKQRFIGSLGMAQRVELLSELLLTGDKRDLYFDLLRLDWRLYGHGQALLPQLRGSDDKKGVSVGSFNHEFVFLSSGLVDYRPVKSKLQFTYDRKIGVNQRAETKKILATEVNL